MSWNAADEDAFITNDPLLRDILWPNWQELL